METVYVSLQDDDRISIFSLDPDEGTLSPTGNLDVPGGPAPLAIDATGGFLYAGLRGSPGIAVFTVNGDRLERIGSTKLESDPCFLTLDGPARFLYCTYYGAGMVTVHRVEPGGSVDPDPVQVLPTDKNAHSLWITRSGRHAFVPHTGPCRLLQFVVDPTRGTLRANEPSEAPVTPGVEPRHMVADPVAPRYYCANEAGSSVTAYRIDEAAGTLSALGTVSTLPPGYSGENTCAQIRITPDGRRLYVSNRGHDSIAVFTVNPDTGLPFAEGHTATEKMPRAIGMDAAGTTLMVSGIDTGHVSVYRISPNNGGLTLSDRRQVGARPMWVLPSDSQFDSAN